MFWTDTIDSPAGARVDGRRTLVFAAGLLGSFPIAIGVGFGVVGVG